ncbi:Uncharacterized protein CK203_098747 [Vitis vinifera]|uniref:Single-stranded DNA binding protein Ssb-like OB fold domain-containing protein n=1 Tax=Vitis vinifera TaxID=29760 RepID=A0A438EGF7_VITVI|nr:Uncharacterized protein CK203_098747 [Vitis vinifera]
MLDCAYYYLIEMETFSGLEPVNTLPIVNHAFRIDMMKAGATVILRNAKIDMFKGSMRLAVDKWGRVEVTRMLTL